MNNNKIPLQEISIDQLYNGENAYWEIPIYQRNYAWEKDEVFALVQDVFDAFNKDEKSIYYIGTLVSFYKGDNIFEIIDGQQRLTTINLILKALEIPISNPLTYRARKKSDNTLKALPKCAIQEQDQGLINGYRFAENAIKEIISNEQLESFKKYFLNNVHIIHYKVPRDIDLNHYFEIMNSRGEQLEKHEIIKARLLATLKNDRTLGSKFNTVWECCSEMNVYIQQKFQQKNSRIELFGKQFRQFLIPGFDQLPEFKNCFISEPIENLLNLEIDPKQKQVSKDKEDSFLPIIDFSNFLLIVLKLTLVRNHKQNFNFKDFNLDDKELINEFDKISLTADFAKCFCYNLLKAKFFLDNFIVHHSCEDDTMENNPWKLQLWQYGENDRQYPQNLIANDYFQDKALQLLSMFEVSFTARQRKNYLLYILLYLFDWYSPQKESYEEYVSFLEQLAYKYFNDVYLKDDNLNKSKVPLPGSFDNEILNAGNLNLQPQDNIDNFEKIYGSGTDRESDGIPLFVFNYLDYKIWQKYADELRGGKFKKGSDRRVNFFESLGCSDFDLSVFQKFYFSRTRRSLEHYFPQANADGKNGNPNQMGINCLGNYAMIGSDINSSGSNWSPKTKLDHYLDSSGKVKQVSVASLKFMIMMQICRDKQTWGFEEIKNHQVKMIEILKN